jgi:oligopeptide transport system substrate-binding protein
VDSAITQEKLFRSGQIHVTTGLPPTKVDIYREAQESPLVDQPVSRTQYLAVNLNRPPLDDSRVRLALALAIDRVALVRPVYKDTATPLGRYLPIGVKGYHPPDIEIGFDPERAKMLLEEAGYPNGDGFPDIEVLVASGQAGRAIATALQAMWRDVLNIRVSATTQEFQVYLNSLVSAEFDLAYAGWNGGPVPAGFLDRWITGSLTNDSHFSHSGYDRLIIEKSRSTPNLEELMTIYRQAEEILLTELPIIPLLQAHATYLKQPSVGGMPPNTLNVIDMKALSVADIPVWQLRGR